MAMALNCNNKHYHHNQIQFRHFLGTFEQAGLSSETILAEAAAVRDAVDAVVDAVAKLPIADGFEPTTVTAILEGLQRMSRSALP